jgi:hypothetical protein
MKKLNPSIFTIELPIYNIDLIVSFYNTRENVVKYVKKYWSFPDPDKIVVDAGGAWGVTSYLSYGGPILLRVECATDVVKTISHEVVHVVAYIMRSRGIEYTEASEEAFAYLTGHITSEIYKQILK